MHVRDYLRCLERPSAIESFVLSHGREFSPVPRPKGMRKRKSGTCFASAGKIALDDPSLFYVEGFVMGLDESKPIHHAWLTPDGLTAVDPIPHDATLGTYFGVVFSKRAAAEIMIAHPHFGIFNPLDDVVTGAMSRHPWQDVIG